MDLQIIRIMMLVMLVMVRIGTPDRSSGGQVKNKKTQMICGTKNQNNNYIFFFLFYPQKTSMS